MSAVFDQAFAAVVGVEGGFSATLSDPGNWTGGKVGSGTLRGTKYGISAAAYPNKDIANLTVEDAKSVYFSDYWAKIRGDDLPPALALLAFDSACNNGVSRAARWLQQAAGVAQDGVIGPATLAAIRAHQPVAIAVEFHARRMLFMLQLPTAKTFGLGWARRLALMPFAAVSLLDAPAAPAPVAPSPQPVPAPQPTPTLKPAPAPVPAIDPEIERRKQLEDAAYVAALNQRP